MVAQIQTTHSRPWALGRAELALLHVILNAVTGSKVTGRIGLPGERFTLPVTNRQKVAFRHGRDRLFELTRTDWVWGVLGNLFRWTVYVSVWLARRCWEVSEDVRLGLLKWPGMRVIDVGGS